MNCYSGPGNTNTPHNNYPATITGKMMYSAATNYPYMVVPKIGKISTSTGQNAPAPITLVQPVLATNFIICINGDFPPTPTT
jgi:microcystin-dependent protein